MTVAGTVVGAIVCLQGGDQWESLTLTPFALQVTVSQCH